MESLGWRQRRGSSPAARRGARQRAGLTPASSFNTLHACWRCFTQNSSGQSKCCLTVITVSTASGIYLLRCVSLLLALFGQGWSN